MNESSSPVRELVVDAAAAAADLIARPAVGELWEGPSALAGMTVGALSAHLVRATGSTTAYLDRTERSVQPDSPLLSAVTYFHAALEAPIHDRIREVSADEATVGHVAVANRSREVAAELRRRLPQEPPDRLIGALGGRMLTLDDFCRTRLIEVLLHLDDLAVSVGEDRPPTDPAGIAIVVDVLTGIARVQHGDWTVARALSRAERVEEPVFPVF